MDFDKNKFWDDKILGWEGKRYSVDINQSHEKKNVDLSLGSSLQFRLFKSVELLSPHISGKKLLELGCGSGLLFKALSQTNMAKYNGVDWASSAIDKANNEFKDKSMPSSPEFMSGNFLDMDFPKFDVVVALGVLDWLDTEEINLLFSKIKPKKFLFSISEKRISIKRWLHSIYILFSYGWKSKGYVPKYYKVDEIIEIAHDHGYSDIKVFRDSKMSFGTFLYQFD